MQRRNFLKIAGTGGIILSAGAIGSGVFITTRTPDSALHSWQTPGVAYTDPMRNALSFAILAPNPHNRQPWIVDLKSDTEALLICDKQRLLPATDPYSRQIVIGLGCFLELFEMAARQNGYRARIRLFPDGEPGKHLDSKPIAHLKLSDDPQIIKDPLFPHALNRRTNRNPYDTSLPIEAEKLAEILANATPIEAWASDIIAQGVTHGPRLDNLRELTRQALRDEILDPHAFQESVDLMRIGRSEIETNPDGISLGGAFLESLNLLGILNREKLADPESSAFKIGLDMADEQALTAMGFVWINTADNSRTAQITAGRRYMRIALSATRQGLSMQPMSQALQEYAAMQPYYKQIHALLSKHNGERIQMLARLGYTKDIAPSPRWALSTRIKHNDV